MFFTVLSMIREAKRKAIASAASVLGKRSKELAASARRVAAEKAEAERLEAEEASERAALERAYDIYIAMAVRCQEYKAQLVREIEAKKREEREAFKRAELAAADRAGLDVESYRWYQAQAHRAEAEAQQAKDIAYSASQKVEGFMAYGM